MGLLATWRRASEREPRSCVRDGLRHESRMIVCNTYLRAGEWHLVLIGSASEREFSHRTSQNISLYGSPSAIVIAHEAP